MATSSTQLSSLDDKQRVWLTKMGAILDTPVEGRTTTGAGATTKQGAVTASGAKNDQATVRADGKGSAQDAPKSPSLVGNPILKEGATGQDVKDLQTLLIQNGASLNDDGKFGPLTTKAVKEFQTKKGLKPDGIVGPKTQIALSETPPEPPKPDTRPRRAVVIVTDAATNDAVNDADVKIADQTEKTGNRGEATFSLPPGKHPFGVTADGFEQAIGIFEVTTDEESQLRVELKAGERGSKTVLTVSPAGKSNKGDKLLLTATVTVGGGKTPATGTVRFDVILNQGPGRKTLKDLVPLTNGKATHTETLLPKGSHLLDVTYKPDTQNVVASQSDPVPHEIEQDEKSEDKDVAKRIVDKLNDDDSEGIEEELVKLRFRPMRRLLNVMVFLQKAGKLEDLLNRLTSDKPENDRLAVAVFTIQHQFTRQWFKLFEKASESDRKALLTRTPEKVKAAFELENEPSDPPNPQDEPDDPNANIVIEPGISTTAKIEFESKQFGGFGSTEFEVKIGPNGRMKSVELDMTIVKEKLEKVTGLGPVLDLEGKLSLNVEAEFEKNDRKVVVEEVQAAVKGEVQVKFPEIKVLKNVVFSLAAKFNNEGKFEFEAAVLIPIPGT